MPRLTATKKATVRKRLSIRGAGLDDTEDELVAVELRGRAEAGEEEFCGGWGGEADVCRRPRAAVPGGGRGA
jgi:hypothetical protein